jgi:UDP-N-acetylglucosamine 2-epimerase (non-hydrolysing)
MKVLNVVGTRPNFVKVAPLLMAMRRRSNIQPVVVHTGQHYSPEMSDDFFRELEIPEPDVNLEVGPASPAVQTAEIMKRLEPLVIRQRPDVVVVVGDVTSTLAAALTAVKLEIPVAHVEAGLRSFDRTMPEEINRLVTDTVSDLLFASEPSGVENLLHEGRRPDQIFLVGNVMIDTLQRFLTAARRSTTLNDLGLLNHGDTAPGIKYAVVTLHRPSTVDSPKVFRKIWRAIQNLARQIRVVFPVHPRTEARLRDGGFNVAPVGRLADATRGMQVIPPLSYLRFLHLQSEATLVITDSGGIQEETTALGVPCLTVRENTERPITVIEGTNTIVGVDERRIQEEASRILSGKGKQGRVPRLWDGHASERIVEILGDSFGPPRKRRKRQATGCVVACR